MNVDTNLASNQIKYKTAASHHITQQWQIHRTTNECKRESLI